MEIINLLVFLGVASLVFYAFSGILGYFGLSKSKFDSFGAAILLILMAVVFFAVFGFDGGVALPSWERLQRR